MSAGTVPTFGAPDGDVAENAAAILTGVKARTLVIRQRPNPVQVHLQAPNRGPLCLHTAAIAMACGATPRV